MLGIILCIVLGLVAVVGGTLSNRPEPRPRRPGISSPAPGKVPRPALPPGVAFRLRPSGGRRG